MGYPADTVREFLERHYPDYGYRDGRFILAAPSGVALRSTLTPANTDSKFFVQTGNRKFSRTARP